MKDTSIPEHNSTENCPRCKYISDRELALVDYLVKHFGELSPEEVAESLAEVLVVVSFDSFKRDELLDLINHMKDAAFKMIDKCEKLDK